MNIIANMILYLLGGFIFIFACLFDILYFLRGIVCSVYWRLAVFPWKWLSPLAESQISCICTTHDLDFLFHMNNARYLRECDFARFKLFIQNGIFHAASQMGGGIVLGASSVRFRRSLQLFQLFVIKSRIVCWDSSAMYVEQRIVRSSDDFICAIVLCKQSFTGVTPDQVLRTLLGSNGLESPFIPKEILTWIEYNNISSKNLRNNAD